MVLSKAFSIVDNKYSHFCYWARNTYIATLVLGIQILEIIAPRPDLMLERKCKQKCAHKDQNAITCLTTT